MNRNCYLAGLTTRWNGVIGVVLLSGLLFMAAQVSAQESSEMVRWLDDYDEALAEARRTGKPIFLEFRCAP